MKKLSLIVIVVFFTSPLQTNTLIATFKGKLRGTDTRDVHTLDMKSGHYRYVLKLTGNKYAKAKFKIVKNRLTGLPETLIKMKKMKNRETYSGSFTIRVKGVVGQNTEGTRETRFIISKKAGPKQINYNLKIYKKD